MDAANEVRYNGLEIVYHGSRSGAMRVGYHCPACLRFYTEGLFSIENETHLLARKIPAVCCGVELPTPALFSTEELRSYIESIESDVPCHKERLIPKKGLERSLYNPDAIAFFKKNPDTRLRIMK